MGWFSSKTVTYVSSSTSPMFDSKRRVDNFQAAMIDHTSTLSMEQSEYLRAHYNSSRLKNLLGLNRWANRTGFFNALGKIRTNFYNDGSIDYIKVGEAIKPILNLKGDNNFGVYDACLSFFSEDYWVKHLASLQGKDHWFYDEAILDYTISNPTDKTIRATFKDGRIIEGPLPSYEAKTRFLAISYSYILTQTVIPPPPPSTTPENPAPPQTSITTYNYKYGFYFYKENDGLPILDEIIKKNGITKEQSYYPVIPLRTNTWWIRDSRKKHINDALAYLQLCDPKKAKNIAFEDLISNCEKGMKGGSIGDIDYITLLLGVSINSRNQADLRYMFEYFFNCYRNYAISIGEKPQSFIGGKPLWGKRGSLNGLHKRFRKFLLNRRPDSAYTKLEVINWTSNFHLTYGWLTCDYFECNGKFKENAKIGDYGVLAGEYVYEWTTRHVAKDSEGDTIYEWKDGKYQVKYIYTKHSDSYNMVMFCYQSSINRWKALPFVDLKLINHVYAGKTINTDAFEAIKDSNTLSEVKHDFSGDYDGLYETWKILTFKYVEITGENDSAFIIPLEENTLHETGAKNALDISYGCYYLVFNCWVQKKKKWYQNGFFSAVISFVGIALSFMFPALAPLILLVTGIFIVNTVLTLLTKVLSIVFGERWATKIVDFALQIIKGIVGLIGSIAFKIPVIGWIIWGICVAIQFNLTAGEILWKGGTMSQAIKGGAKAAIISGIASAVAGQIAGPASVGSSAASGTASSAGGSIAIGSMANQVVVAGSVMTTGQFVAMSATNSFITGSLGSLFNGESLGSSLKEGFKQGAIAGALAYMTSVANDLGFSKSLKGKAMDFSKFQEFGWTDWAGFAGDLFVEKLVNINTFAEFMKMGIEEVYFHKMANLENDYQEFNNKYAAANKVLNQLLESVTGTTTAESVCKMQAILGRLLTIFPDSVQSLDTETMLAMSTLTGSDVCKTVLGNIDCWCDSQLTMDGYNPSDLHYSTFSNTLTWDANLRTAA